MSPDSGGFAEREPGASALGELGAPLGSSAGRRAALMLSASVLLAAGHLALAALWPRLTSGQWATSAAAPEQLRPTINLAWYAANLFCLANVLVRGQGRELRRFAAWAAGYAVIVWLLWPLMRIMAENTLLLVLAVVVYGGLLHHPRLLGYLYLFLICQRFLPAYLYASFGMGCLLYTTLPPFVHAWRRQRERFVPLCHLSGLILLAVLLIPIVFFCTQSSPQDLGQRLTEAEVLAALGVSLKTSALATLAVLLLGVPFAYAMVRRPFPARGLVDTLIDLPIVIPSPVVGIALLAFLGPKSPPGIFLARRLGIEFFDSQWGIVAAQIFVGSPFLIRASMVAFEAVDVRYENVARTLGASTASAFFRLTLPMSTRGVLIGVILTWFRAMGEFGALCILAYRPHTIPILAYERFIHFSQVESHSVGILILLLCLSVVVGMWIIRSVPGMVGRVIGVANVAD